MEYLTKPVRVDTGKIIIQLRLLLNDRQKNLLIMVSDGSDTQRKVLTSYPYHYQDFNKEETQIKEYITSSLEKDYIKHTPQDVTQLFNYLREDMENETKASTNFPKENFSTFIDIFKACQKDISTNSIINIADVKENGKATTPQAITRDILINKYQDIIDKINNGETKELVLDCNDFDIIITGKSGVQYPLIDRLKHSPQDFIEIVQKELNNLIHERPPSLNPYEIKEDQDLYYLRFKNLPETTPLKYMLSGQVGRFTQTQGLVQGVYPARPKIKVSVHECRGCMRLYENEVPSDSNKIIEPSVCDECGGRSFRLREDLCTYTNERYLLLTEPPEELNLEDNPRQLLVNLVGNKEFVTSVNAGARINLTGVLSSVEDKDKKQFIYTVNNLDKLEDKTIKLTGEDKRKFLQLSKKDDILDILVSSFAPELILPRELKESILLYLVKSGEDLKALDMIHILIISDPATAKTSLKEKVKELTEKGVLASGTGSSGVGLTGAIVKDPITNNWVLTAGAIPLANNGHCIIDEIDKMSKEDSTHANNFMESGYDDFNKAGVNGRLIGKTSILALGNPKFGRYDRYKSLQDQVDIDPTFQSRFDLIFLIEDKPNSDKDSKIIESILNGYSVQDNKEDQDTNSNVHEIKILVTEDLKKYLAFARNEFKPKLTPEARRCIKDYGLKVRGVNLEDGEAPYHWRFIRSIPKLAGAYAKLHLRPNITKEDVQRAIKLKEYSIKLIGLDPITNTIDTDRVTGNLNRDDKRQREIIKYLIKDYVEDPNNLDSEGIPSKTLLENYQEETSKSKETFYRRLKELKEAGEVIELGKGRNKQYKVNDTV